MRERSPGHWELRAYVGRDDRGRPIQRTRSFRGGKRQAQAQLAKLVAEVEAKGVPLSGDVTVAELLDRWLEHIGPQREPGTIRGYQSTARRVKAVLGTVKVSKLTAQHLDRAYRDWQAQGLSAGTVRHAHAVLAAALHQAVRWELIPRAVTDLAKPPALDTSEQTPVTPDDLQKLIHAAEVDSPILAAAISLAALTGARREELCGLRWTDLDANGVLTIARAVKHDVDRRQLVVRTTKTRQVRRVALDPLGRAVWATHRERVEEWARRAEVELAPNGYVLTDDLSGREPWKPDTLTSAFARLARKVGVRVRFHDLRHFSATQLIGAGVDVRTVAGRLGHADATTTLRTYAHAIEARDREAAAILGQLVAPAGS
jgi:integrase